MGELIFRVLQDECKSKKNIQFVYFTESELKAIFFLGYRDSIHVQMGDFLLQHPGTIITNIQLFLVPIWIKIIVFFRGGGGVGCCINEPSPLIFCSLP